MYDLSDYRKNYSGKTIKATKNPLLLFEKWFKEAEKSEYNEVNAFVLSTVNEKMQPQSRIVLLKNFSEKGFIFYTNYFSKKGREISHNSNVSLLFYWSVLQRQVRINGTATKLTPQESDEYFYSRPLENQISAIISKQSQVLESRKVLVQNFRQALKGAIPKRPENWGGYIVSPTYYEFWQGMPSRLHDRLVYEKQINSWKYYKLYP